MAPMTTERSTHTRRRPMRVPRQPFEPPEPLPRLFPLPPTLITGPTLKPPQPMSGPGLQPPKPPPGGGPPQRGPPPPRGAAFQLGPLPDRPPDLPPEPPPENPPETRPPPENPPLLLPPPLPLPPDLPIRSSFHEGVNTREVNLYPSVLNRRGAMCPSLWTVSKSVCKAAGRRPDGNPSGVVFLDTGFTHRPRDGPAPPAQVARTLPRLSSRFSAEK